MEVLTRLHKGFYDWYRDAMSQWERSRSFLIFFHLLIHNPTIQLISWTVLPLSKYSCEHLQKLREFSSKFWKIVIFTMGILVKNWIKASILFVWKCGFSSTYMQLKVNGFHKVYRITLLSKLITLNKCVWTTFHSFK